MKLENYKVKQLEKKRNDLFKKRNYHTDRAEAYSEILHEINREFVRRLLTRIIKEARE